ncbi:MAG TPA: bifunctional hydroxymethylpyrimidine kinase/phosphomethylpyrimidine kinase [Rhizomicrobium sp.]
MNGAPARVLIIAGSDSGGGAGLQADIKTAAALGVYAATAVTAVTVQNTRGIYGIHPIPASIVCDQITRVLDDIGADAIKLGMLGSATIVEAVADALQRRAHEIPVVLDPVLASSSGTALVEGDAIAALKTRLFPLVALVTPNIPEAETLAGIPVCNTDDMHNAGEILRALGASAVLVKGGHAKTDTIEDVLVSGQGVRVLSSPRIESRHTHGTGCTLSTAIACGLAQGTPLAQSIERARAFVQEAIRTAPGFGRGNGPLNHLVRL